MKVVQTILNVITAGQFAVSLGGVISEGVVADDGLNVSKSEKITIGDYVRWACAGDEPISVATGTKQRMYTTELYRYELAICKTAERDGDLVVICRTAEFEGGIRSGTRAFAEREAVQNAITHCRENRE